jgi:hypothetical protein
MNSNTWMPDSAQEHFSPGLKGKQLLDSGTLFPRQ